MANLDTRKKRASSAGIHLYPSGPGVTVNTAKDQAWRQSVGYSYSGIAADAPVVITFKARILIY